MMAFTALLMAYNRQSKRRAAEFLRTLLGQPCCPALTVKIENQVTAAVRPAYEELAAREDFPAVFDAPVEIHLLLKNLSDMRDRTLVLRLIEGATQAEAARELGLTQQAVSARLGHIRRTLAPLMHQGEQA